MIIWGGSWLSALDTGGKYNPVTNIWESTSSGVDVPAARNNHSAVWTGTEMIVWGGSSTGVEFNDGGHYNPTTDTWMPTTAAGAPSPRFDHTAVWTGDEMIVWGGGYQVSSIYYYLADGGRYRCVP